MRQIYEPVGTGVFAVDTEHMRGRADAGYIDAALNAAGLDAWLKRIAG